MSLITRGSKCLAQEGGKVQKGEASSSLLFFFFHLDGQSPETREREISDPDSIFSSMHIERKKPHQLMIHSFRLTKKKKLRNLAGRPVLLHFFREGQERLELPFLLLLPHTQHRWWAGTSALIISLSFFFKPRFFFWGRRTEGILCEHNRPGVTRGQAAAAAAASGANMRDKSFIQPERHELDISSSSSSRCTTTDKSPEGRRQDKSGGCTGTRSAQDYSNYALLLPTKRLSRRSGSLYLFQSGSLFLTNKECYFFLLLLFFPNDNNNKFLSVYIYKKILLWWGDVLHDTNTRQPAEASVHLQLMRGSEPSSFPPSLPPCWRPLTIFLIFSLSPCVRNTWSGRKMRCCREGGGGLKREEEEKNMRTLTRALMSISFSSSERDSF